MFDIPEEYVLEEGVEEAATPEYDDTEVTRIIRNEIDPYLIVDGVDRVTIFEIDADEYFVDYWGFVAGTMRVTREGIERLGASVLGDRTIVPGWIVTTTPSGDSRPGWFPESYDGEPAFDCQHCGTETRARDIVVPGWSEHHDSEAVDRGDFDTFCSDCWRDVGGQYDQDSGILSDSTDRSRAEDLLQSAEDRPNAVDRDTLERLLQSDDTDARVTALQATRKLVDVRPGVVAELLPDVVAGLQADDIDTQRSAAAVLEDLADSRPEHVSAVAPEVIAHLEASTDDRVLESLLSVVADVAEVDPESLLEAVPKLAALLQSRPLPSSRSEDRTLVTLQRIAGNYPDAVVPVTDELLSYLDGDDYDHGVAALAALGYVAKSYPNVARSALPTVVDLLETDRTRLRANAAGLLAEFAEQYPDDVRSATDACIRLLDDEDQIARYNATSILARVAEEYPETVEPATAKLIAVLDDDMSQTRENACWALGRIETSSAVSALEDVASSDSRESVREVATWALSQIDD